MSCTLFQKQVTAQQQRAPNAAGWWDVPQLVLRLPVQSDTQHTLTSSQAVADSNQHPENQCPVLLPLAVSRDGTLILHQLQNCGTKPETTLVHKVCTSEILKEP